jgi:hypothetical protein
LAIISPFSSVNTLVLLSRYPSAMIIREFRNTIFTSVMFKESPDSNGEI